MIRIGQAGIPLSCKGRTNKDGLVYTHDTLDFNAMEIQIVRGLYVIPDEELLFIKEYAEENDMQLIIHAPYYLNLAGDDEEKEMSIDKVVKSCVIASKINASYVVVHPGFYGDHTPEKTSEKIINAIKEIQQILKNEGVSVCLALETMGKKKVFGSLEEIVSVCTKLDNVYPAIDVGHIHSRTNGGLKTYEDFEAIFEQLSSLNLNHFLIHVTGVLYEDGNEFYHVPIKKGDMPVMPLIDLILDKRLNVTLISESPLLEHDAGYLRLQVERAIMKRTGKEEADYRDLSELYTD